MRSQIAGRLAQFGRGIIEGVSKRLTTDMANCIRIQLEDPDAANGEQRPANEAASVNALGLLGSVMSDKLRRRG